MPDERRGASLAAHLLLSAASVLVVLLACELVLRLLDYAPARYRSTARVFSAHHSLLLDCYPTNPRGYFPIDLRSPGVIQHYQALRVARVAIVARRAPWAVETRYNSLGFRGPEPPPRRPGVRRLVLLGDSFTEGQGVKENDTGARRLQALLDVDEPGRWQVMNAGRRGLDFPELRDAFSQALALDPDTVVLAFVLNDAERSPEFQSRQTYLNDWIVDRSHMAGSSAPAFPLLRPRVLAWLQERWHIHRVSSETRSWYLGMYGPDNALGWAHTRAYLREMAETMRDRHGSFAVAIWPLLVDLDGRYPFDEAHGTLRRFLAEAGIPCLDLLAVLRGKRTQDLWVHPVDHHPNEVANRLIAERLRPFVEEITR